MTDTIFTPAEVPAIQDANARAHELTRAADLAKQQSIDAAATALEALASVAEAAADILVFLPGSPRSTRGGRGRCCGPLPTPQAHDGFLPSGDAS